MCIGIFDSHRDDVARAQRGSTIAQENIANCDPYLRVKSILSCGVYLSVMHSEWNYDEDDDGLPEPVPVEERPRLIEIWLLLVSLIGVLAYMRMLIYDSVFCPSCKRADDYLTLHSPKPYMFQSIRHRFPNAYWGFVERVKTGDVIFSSRPIDFAQYNRHVSELYMTSRGHFRTTDLDYSRLALSYRLKVLSSMEGSSEANCAAMAYGKSSLPERTTRADELGFDQTARMMIEASYFGQLYPRPHIFGDYTDAEREWLLAGAAERGIARDVASSVLRLDRMANVTNQQACQAGIAITQTALAAPAQYARSVQIKLMATMP